MKLFMVDLATKTGCRVTVCLVHSINTVKHTVFLKLQPSLRAIANTVVEMQHWGTVWLQLCERWSCMKRNHWQSIRGEKNISVLARNIACWGILKAYLIIENIQSVLKVLYILLHWIGFLFKKKKNLISLFKEPRRWSVRRYTDLMLLFSFAGRSISRSRSLLAHVQRLYSACVFMSLIHSPNLCRKSWGILAEPFPDNDYIDHIFGFWVVLWTEQYLFFRTASLEKLIWRQSDPTKPTSKTILWL